MNRISATNLQDIIKYHFLSPSFNCPNCAFHRQPIFLVVKTLHNVIRPPIIWSMSRSDQHPCSAQTQRHLAIFHVDPWNIQQPKSKRHSPRVAEIIISSPRALTTLDSISWSAELRASSVRHLSSSITSSDRIVNNLHLYSFFLLLLPINSLHTLGGDIPVKSHIKTFALAPHPQCRLKSAPQRIPRKVSDKCRAETQVKKVKRHNC